MSKKRPRRPRRRARLAQRMQERRYRSADDTDPSQATYMLTVPPWNLFDEISANSPEESSDEISTVAAHIPFCLESADNPVTLAELAEQSGVTIPELVDQLRWLADRGYLRWDDKQQMVVLTIPEHGANSTGIPVPTLNRTKVPGEQGRGPSIASQGPVDARGR